MVFLILVLVVAGLNISNEGINQLTGEQRKAVAAVNMGPENLYLQWLGKEYTYPREKLTVYSDKIRTPLREFPDYLTRIGRITRILLLEPLQEKMQSRYCF